MTLHKRIGGIHFFAIGPLRVQFSWAKRKRPTLADIEAIREGIDCKPMPPAYLHADGIIRDYPELPKVSAYTWPEGVAAALEERI